MGRTVNNGGDVLARGGVKATFRQPDVTEEKYNEATQDFDLAKFLRKKLPTGDGKKEKVSTRSRN